MMKKKRFLSILLILSVLFTAVPVSADQTAPKKADTEETQGKAMESAAVQTSIPADAVSWSGHYYKLYSTKMTVAEADSYCKSLGGYLATITSDAERGIVADLIQNLSSHDDFYAIGGRTGSFDAQKGFSNTEAHWDTGEEDTVNYWKGNVYPDYCERQDSAYRYFGWYREYYNTPLYRPAGYYWDVISRDETEQTFGFICEWGDQIDIADTECTPNSSYVIYDGNAKNPGFTIKYQGVTLESSHDYTYEYTNNLNPGTASITITGIGRFKGTTTINFSVEPSISLLIQQSEEITTVYCFPAELPIGNKEYLKTFMSGLRLELSKQDQKKVKGMSNSFGISEDGRNATWQTSLTGLAEGKIHVKITTEAGQSIESDVDIKPIFEENQYRADYLLNDENRMKAMEYYITTESASATLVNNGETNKLGTAAAFWTFLTTIGDGANNPGTILDLPFKEKEMYQALLLDIFKKSMENEMLANVNEFTSKAKSALEMATSFSGNVNTLESYIFFLNTGETYDSMWNEKINYAAEDVAGIINKALELLKLDNYKINTEGIEKLFGAASTAKEAISIAQEILEYVIACNQMSVMTGDMQKILNEMYAASGSNTQMRLAIRELSAMVNDCTGTIMTNVSLMAGKKLTQTLISSFWKEMKLAAGPTVNGYLAAYQAGKLIANNLSGAEKTAEAFVKMKAVLEIESLVKSIYNTKKTKYKQSKNSEDAALYLAATEIIFNALDTDYACAIEFCNVVDKAWSSKILNWFDLNNADALQKSLTSIRSSIASMADQISIDWVYDLRRDYPSQYETYKNIIEDREASAYYEIHCPVNVEVYNASGKTAASVVNKKAFWDGESDLVISAAGDGAEIWFYGNSDFYNIQYTGTDAGSMDVIIQKFDETGNQTQKVQYNKVPLTNGCVYESEENLQDDTGSYVLSDKNDAWNTIDPDVNTASPVKAKRRVMVKNGYLLYDPAKGPANDAECYPGETIYVYTARTNQNFTEWKDSSGKIEFLDKTALITSFRMPDADVEIEAVYGNTTTPGGTDNPGTSDSNKSDVPPKSGTKLTDAKTKMEYVVDIEGKSVLFRKPKDKKMKSLTIPDSVKLGEISYTVTGIADNALSGCSKLKSVSMGNSISSIGAKAFYKCKALAKITIPVNVLNIGKQAFGGCKKLKSITIKTEKLTKKSVGANAFKGIHKKAKFSVPKKQKKNYKKIFSAKGAGKKVNVK